jgi:hypothetical protein
MPACFLITPLGEFSSAGSKSSPDSMPIHTGRGELSGWINGLHWQF